MKSAMTSFFTADRLQKLSTDIGVPCSFSPGIAEIARSFVELQDARHLADYDTLDLETKVGLLWATECVDEAQRTFDAWDRARSTDAARLLLASIAFSNKWVK